jgi:sugar lactone lactonase YvrE
MKAKLFLPLILLGVVICRSAAAYSLTPVFQDNVHQFTGVAISRTGRMFINFPRWEAPHQFDVVEVLPNGEVLPYPNAAWNSWTPGTDGSNHWVCVQAVYVDDQDKLWVVDPGSPDMKGVQDQGAKVVSIDLKTDHVLRVYDLTDLVGKKAYLNDIRVDTQTGTAYLTESAIGGLVVLDTKEARARLVLRKHYSVKADPSHVLTIDGQELKRQGKPFRGNSDGIALSPDCQWLYYKSLSDTRLYRIRTADLRNDTLTESDLEKRVDDLGANFTTSDGMIFDRANNLYLSDAEHNQIVRVTPQLKLSVMVHDQRLLWPDTFAWSTQGELYVTCSQIQKMPWCHGGKSTRTSPYTIYRISR